MDFESEFTYAECGGAGIRADRRKTHVGRPEVRIRDSDEARRAIRPAIRRVERPPHVA